MSQNSGNGSSSFPSRSIALEEARRRYDLEQTRKGQIESKIGGIIAVNTLLISLVGSLSPLSVVTTVIALLPALFSAGVGVAALNPREYKIPGPPVDELYTYARKPEAGARRALLDNYRKAVNSNSTTHDDRVCSLKKCIYLTGCSFILVIASPLFEEVVINHILKINQLINSSVAIASGLF